MDGKFEKVWRSLKKFGEGLSTMGARDVEEMEAKDLSGPETRVGMW